MRLAFSLWFLSPIIATIAAGQQYDESEKIYVTDSLLRKSYVRTVFDEAPAQFSEKFIQEVAKENRLNRITSPIGVSLVLSMASFGGQGYTRAVIGKALGNDYCTPCTKIGLQGLVDRLNGYKSVRLSVATAAFISSSIQVNPEYAKTCVRAFRSPAQSIDFSRSAEASSIVNSWCTSRTTNRTKEIVNPADFDANTRFVLASAVYFKGTWQEKFDTGLTQNIPFYCVDGMPRVMPFMIGKRTVRYGYYPEVKSQFIELPFVSEDTAHDMSMFVILPRSIGGLNFLETNSHEITIEKLLSRGTDEKMHIYLPKFKIESELELEKPLRRMNMGDMFEPNKVNFSEIATSPRLPMNPVIPEIFVNKMIQKAVIEINEDGNEAPPPATDEESWGPPVPEEFNTFWVNHPFYFMIVAKGENPLNVLTARFTGIEKEFQWTV